jgi:DNA-binding MarR family transcriptional regulator
MMLARFEMPAGCDVILYVINHRPGISESEIAMALYGKPDQPRVHQDCDLLEGRGLIRRERDSRPMRLYPQN